MNERKKLAGTHGIEPRPPGLESGALPTELHALGWKWCVWMDSNHRACEGPGLQPDAIGLSATHPVKRNKTLAETVGLEPTHPLLGLRFSRPLPLVLSRLRSPWTGSVRRVRTSNARLFRLALYQLSYHGLDWRPVRDSNPRLPTRQVGTLATELTEHVWWRRQGSNLRPAACKAAALPKLSYTPRDGSGDGFRCRPIVAADLRLSSFRSAEAWCWWVAPAATSRTRDLPLTRRLLCLLSYAGLALTKTSRISLRVCSSASAVFRCKALSLGGAGVPAPPIAAVPALRGTRVRPLGWNTPAMRCPWLVGRTRTEPSCAGVFAANC